MNRKWTLFSSYLVALYVVLAIAVVTASPAPVTGFITVVTPGEDKQ